mmetsp:Transcript_14121/g.39515  ORF Transcript_14121/g.39515 Transcript_14121/m.39515 type:complete len:1451 (+) Transcript_14121:776-5128(+)|eukprot:CAMPEP_0172380112 /NCGR_PEP_ID=MMETSP1060-20121228/70271_1 /TAXON_ID=37318 /ORGANISM="Pseudo-nitzschia pungens, Strain cf. cingulata" /LENGTH=1450 /DNA_ID=CAMNT_0013107861 /DNA_START=701 /DNA_END=5053 /DNA_ORIENTATION=+
MSNKNQVLPSENQSPSARTASSKDFIITTPTDINFSSRVEEVNSSASLKEARTSYATTCSVADYNQSSPPSSPGSTLSCCTLSSSSFNGVSNSSCAISIVVSSPRAESPPLSPPRPPSPSILDEQLNYTGMIIHNQFRSNFKFNDMMKDSVGEKTSTSTEQSLSSSYNPNDVNTSQDDSVAEPSVHCNNTSMNDAGMRSDKFISSTGNGTRVWVKKSALDAIRNPRPSFKEKMSRKPPLTSFNSSFNGGSFHGSMSVASAPVPTRQASFISMGGASVASFSSQRDIFGDSDSDIGSIGGSPFFNQSTRFCDQWGWTSACMIDSSNGTITLQLDEAPVNSAASDASSSLISSTSSTGNNEQTVTMPASAWSDGDIVMGNEYELSNEGNPICPDDLISLSHLHEPAVVECLQHRYDDDRIYTATGPVLLALNPFQNIEDLYGESTMKKYWEKAENQSKDFLPPHVYAIADEAFRNMMRSLEQSLGASEKKSCDQSILVSGESGAGKTVTTKFVMKYLAALSQRAGSQKKEKRAYQKVAEEKKRRSGSTATSTTTTPSYLPPRSSSSSSAPSWVKTTNSSFSGNNKSTGRKSVDGLSDVTSLVGTDALNSIEAQVLQSNPILESFGNARTMRNDNSSRFGKFIEIQFTRTGRLVGAQIETYLLEKVRLVTQSLGERNYHIFYEMLSGGVGADELRNYFIASTASPDDFKITASGTLDRRDGISDQDTCKALQAAMKTMKFSVDEQTNVFATAAAILHASNLTFCDFDQYCQLDGNNVHLEPVCHLLGVTAEDLNQSLCHFSITAGRESQVQQNLDIDKAEKGLEALLKATYGALFTFLVGRINDSICFNPDAKKKSSDPGSKDTPCASIGVLDIFGFESFKTNSFEQLCINYCNEALQQQFNAFVLKNEQAEYEREGIEWSFIEFPENQDVIDLIDKRGSGILCILDDQCLAPGTSDRSFALDIYNKCKSHARFSANRKQTAVLQFCVNHYAGPVEYTTSGFVEKNRDKLPKEATELLQTSFNPFIRLLASLMESSGDERSSNSKPEKPVMSRSQSVSSFGRGTVGGQFRRQLKRLREKIDVMSPHYVRCLKPNDQLVPDHFDKAAIADQLSCGGILEAVRVARAGYSNHYTHEDFLRRYRCLGGDALKSSKPQISGESPRPRKKFFAGAVSISPSASGGSSTDRSTSNSTLASCKTLVKHLCLLLQEGQKDDDNDENEKNSANTTPLLAIGNTTAQVKVYKHQVTSAPPSWARKGNSSKSVASIWDKKISSDSRPPAPETRRKSFCKDIGGTASTSAKLGVQIGKTKVFLRHNAFESLERLRSQRQSRAAVKLNSIFRLYLARIAYVHVRNAVRSSMVDLQTLQSDEWKESKVEDDNDGRLVEFYNRLNQMRHSFAGQSFSLVEAWASQMREKIHNPTLRSEWGKTAPSKPFKWMLVDGLWVKNHDLCDDSL